MPYISILEKVLFDRPRRLLLFLDVSGRNLRAAAAAPAFIVNVVGDGGDREQRGARAVLPRDRDVDPEAAVGAGARPR